MSQDVLNVEVQQHPDTTMRLAAAVWCYCVYGIMSWGVGGVGGGGDVRWGGGDGGQERGGLCKINHPPHVCLRLREWDMQEALQWIGDNHPPPPPQPPPNPMTDGRRQQDAPESVS